jgi:hypothetical protein
VEKWRFKTGGNVPSAAVANGIVYYGGYDKNLYAVDAMTGVEKWRFAMGSPASSSPAVANGVVYVGREVDNMYAIKAAVLAIDAETGKEKWQFETGGLEIWSSPVVSNGVVYFGSMDNNMYAIGQNQTSATIPLTPGQPSIPMVPGLSSQQPGISIIIVVVIFFGGAVCALWYISFRNRKKPAGLNPKVTQKTKVKTSQAPSRPLIPPGSYQTVPASIPEHQTRDLMDSANEKIRHIPDLVFISSKSADYQYVVTLYDFLLSHEKNVFFSQESLPMMGNADYREEIDKAIDQAKHMIVVGSSVENILSPWVKDEWGAFINEKRSGRKVGSNLITVIVGSVKKEDLPISLRINEVIPYDPEKFSPILNYLK